MAARKANGEGTIYRRKDGRYEGAAYFTAADGKRKRVRVYGKTRTDVRTQLTGLLARSDRGQVLPDRSWRLGDYLDRWLATVVRNTCRPKTYERYEGIIRIYLKPQLGPTKLNRLTVATLQAFINEQVSAGRSANMVAKMRIVLGAALTQAQREELIPSNPARLLRLPRLSTREIQPWTADQAQQFLRAAAGDPLYPAFVLIILYGLRRGEVVGLRWRDIDYPRSLLRVQQQVQRVDGQLRQVPVKTQAGQRELPLLELAASVIAGQAASDEHRNPDALIFQTRFGQPVEPHNLARSFQRIREQAGLERITLHHLRHTTATWMKSLGVPVRDAQQVLGHASPTTTQQIYQHADAEDRRTALTGVERLLTAARDGSRCRQLLPSSHFYEAYKSTVQSGRGDRTRTCDTRFWSFLQNSGGDPLTGALELARGAAQARVLGAVAVATAVSLTPRQTRAAEHARYWLVLLTARDHDAP